MARFRRKNKWVVAHYSEAQIEKILFGTIEAFK